DEDGFRFSIDRPKESEMSSLYFDVERAKASNWLPRPAAISSLARRAMAVPEAILSRQPILPQLQRLPFLSIVICPSSPAIPFAPSRICPSAIMPAPIPVL